MSKISSYLNNEPARDAAQRAQETQQSGNAAALTASEEANDNTLDFQKILAYLQAQQGNVTNAQQLGLALSGLQQQQDQFAQLYNQDQTNNLPLRQAQLAGLSAMTPLMQMAGMQGYNPNTTLDTTKLVAPNVTNDFNRLANMYQQTNESNFDAQTMLQALSDPAAFLATLGGGGTAADRSAVPGGPTFGTNNGPGMPAGNLVKTPTVQTPAQLAANGGAREISQSKMMQQYPTTASPVATPTTASLTPYVGQAQGSQVEQTPAYLFKLAEAQKQMNNQLSAQGLLGSGAATMMGGQMGQQIAGDEYNNQYNRLMDLVKLGMGMEPTTQGTQAASNLANIGQSGQQNVSAALQNAAQGRSSMYSNLGAAYGNNQSNTANTLANYYGANSAAANTYAQQQANQVSGFDKILNTGMKLYGMGAF